MKTYLSREVAITHLKTFFMNTDKDEVTVDQALTSAGRDLSNIKKNKSWFSNKLTSMNEYKLFEKVYSRGRGQTKLVKIRLTEDGKKALGRDVGNSLLQSPAQLELSTRDSKNVTISSIKKDIQRLRIQEPALDVIFDIKLKEDA